MKFRRILFISILFVMFIFCYQKMNEHYDELSRYQYATIDNSDLIVKYMSNEEINYLIERQYKPEEFISYLGLEDFTILKLDWYNHVKSIGIKGDTEIIQYVNKISQKMTYSEFLKYTNNYTIGQIYDFYFSNHPYVESLSLLSDFSKNKIDSKETLFTFAPQNIVKLNNVPTVFSNKIYIKEEVNDAIGEVCLAAFDINQKTCGNMIAIKGYVSYDEQIIQFEEGIIKYGIDDVLNHIDYPGQSIFQFGNVLILIPTGIEENNEEITLQQLWLRENASKYGFEFMNDSEEILKEYILRYVGKDDE